MLSSFRGRCGAYDTASAGTAPLGAARPAHVGHRTLAFALQQTGCRVVALGALTLAEDIVKAATETDADAILVSSLYGHGQLDCQGFRDLCAEAGPEDILLYVGGNLTVGLKDAVTWAEVERAFLPWASTAPTRLTCGLPPPSAT